MDAIQHAAELASESIEITEERNAVLSKVITAECLSSLQPKELVTYYKNVCESNGLNPATKPFLLLRLQGKTKLYATKDCTDQLRAANGVSIRITARERVGELFMVTAQAINKHGRQDESIGAVTISGLKGDALANAIMKAETKAKRRVTLSIAGLGFLDESEVSSIPKAQTLEFDIETGEIIEPKPKNLTPQVTPTSEPAEIKKLAEQILELFQTSNVVEAAGLATLLSPGDKKALCQILAPDVIEWLKSLTKNPMPKEGN